MNSNPKMGVAMVLMAAALWGTTGTAQSLAGGTLSPLWFGALRLLIASVFFACYALVTARAPGGAGSGPPLSAQRLSAVDVVGAGLCMAVYNLAFFAGIQLTGVAAGTAIALGSGPIWAGLLQSAVYRRAPTRGWWLGTLCAVGGGVLLTADGAAASRQVPLAGVLLCLFSGLSYAIYTLLNKRMVRTARSSAITLQAFTVAAAISVPAAWLAGGLPVLALRDSAAVLYTGVITAGVAYLLFSQALRLITPATGVTLALCEPVVAFGLAVWVLGEQPAAWGLLGLLCVVGGVLVVIREELAGAAPRAGAVAGSRAEV